MKKVLKEKRIKFSFVKLYLEDVREILSILHEGGIEKLDLEIGNFKVEEGEIKNLLLKKNNSMSISVYNSSAFLGRLFSLDISGDYFGEVVVCVEDTVVGNGLLQKVGDILKRNRRLLLWLFSGSDFLSFLFLSGLSLSWTLPLLLYFDLPLPFLVFAATVHIFILSFPSFFFKKNLVILEKRSKYPNFFVRNKDALIIGVVNTTLSVLLGFFLGKFFG